MREWKRRNDERVEELRVAREKAEEAAAKAPVAETQADK